jgi:hypothetical protein
VKDRALWITWYDLPEERRDEYLHWLHAVYMPALLERGRFPYAAHYASLPPSRMPQTRKASSMRHTDDPSVPTGDRYILVVGAEDTSVFGEQPAEEWQARLSKADREKLGLRIGVRENVMVDAARVGGPEEAGYADGMKPAPCIQLGSFNCAWQHEQEVLAWYAQWRLKAMRTLPGCVRTRRLASVCGWAKHAVLYEFASLEARNRHFTHHEAEHPEMKAWSDRVVEKLVHAPGSANLALRTWPPAPAESAAGVA